MIDYYILIKWVVIYLNLKKDPVSERIEFAERALDLLM